MDDPLPPDPYKALGIPRDAPLAAVRSAHRKLVLTCHPDKVTDEAAKKTAADRFHLVQQAYEILSDETRRQRYDERSRLLELRAEMGKDKMSSRVVPEFVPRPTKTTTFDVRGGPMYEERAPRRTYDDDDDYFSPRYHEARPKKYDERPSVQTPRKTSDRGADEKRRARDIARKMEDDRDRERRRKEAARAEEKFARSERDKRSSKNKKKDYETKSRSKFSAYVEDDSDSDSDVTERVYARRQDPLPKRRYEEDFRTRERDLPLRDKKYDSYDHYDSKYARVQDDARSYIAKSRIVENDARRPPPSRSYSHVDPKASQPPPPPIDTKRTSGRGSSRRDPSPPPRLSKKDRRFTEIVDPPQSARRPSLPIHFSDPKGLKMPATPSPRREPPRAQTMEYIPEVKHPSMKRAETMPIDRSRRGDKGTPTSTKAKEQHDSGYSSRSSRGTPELSPSESPQVRSTRYRVPDSSESEDEITIVAEPDGSYQRVREVSPKARRPPTTPHSASSMRVPHMRSGSSYVGSPDQPQTPRTAPPYVRTQSGRPPPMPSRPSARENLYGEFSPIEPEQYRVRNQSPRIREEDVKYSDYPPRRGSEDLNREAYPGSQYRPAFARQESRAVRA